MSTYNARKAGRRLTRRQQAKVMQWLADAYNMGWSGMAGKRLRPAEREAARATIEDALIAAVLDFDSSKGAAFSTYLYRKVRWALLDASRPRKSKVANARTFTDVLAEEA
jgi:DNA-directed RNA polymerase specialized sigma24 family protein